FAQANDLIRRKDENGKAAGGMFDANRRVRAMTLRGERSMGFFCPLTYIEKLGVNPERSLQVGDELETFMGYDISKKYVIPPKPQAAVGKKGKQVHKKVSRLIPDQFRFHFDTSHLGRNLHKIQPEDLISISWK